MRIDVAWDRAMCFSGIDDRDLIGASKQISAKTKGTSRRTQNDDVRVALLVQIRNSFGGFG
jgi:hypothetical protein